MTTTEGVAPGGLAPVLGRWELGTALRRIREARGKTIEQVSQELSALHDSGFSPSKISRLETGRRGATSRDVRDLCDYYGVDAAERERLIALARQTRLDNRLQGMSEAYVEYVALESQAHMLRNYESMFVPGLLQTVDYFRALIDSYALSGLDPDSSDDSAKTLVQLRVDRQRRLTGPGALIIDSIIDENVLRRTVGSDSIMAAQLDHVLAVSSLPNVRLRVIPASRGLYPGCESSGFSLLARDEGEPVPENVCYVEGLVRTLWAEKATDRLRVARIFEYLELIALDAYRSREFITDAARRFT